MPVSSCPAQVARPRARARWATSSSCSGVSTENAALTASAWQPALTSRSIASSTAPTSSPPVASMKTCSVRSLRPGARASSPTFVRERARFTSGAAPMPITPTGATSPSSSAFIACVVEKATSSIDRPSPSRSTSIRTTVATPSLTPPGAWCVVGCTASASGCASPGTIAIAFVKVPPTSMPTRTGRRGADHGWPGALTRSPAPRRRAVATGARRTRRGCRRCRSAAGSAGRRGPAGSGGSRSAPRRRWAAAPGSTRRA